MEKKITLFSFLLVLVLLTGCIDSINDVEVEHYEPEIAIPLINTEISIQDLIDNFETGGYLAVEEDNLLTIVYQGNVLSPTGADVVTMEDFEFPVLDTMMAIPISSIPSQAGIKRFDIKSGQFGFSFRSSFNEDFEVTFQVLNLVKNSVSFETSIVVPHNSGGVVTMEDQKDIDGYTFDLSSGNFEVRYEAMGLLSNQRLYLNDVKYLFKNLDYSYVEGTFPSFNFDVDLDSVLINIFETTSVNNLYLEDPKINIHFNNSFGIPIEVKANTLKVYDFNNNPMGIQSQLDLGYDFAYPGLMEVGMSKMSTLSLNKDNSNIAAVIGFNPIKLDYQFSATTFPNAGTMTGFVSDDSYFSVDVDVELPMWFRASAFNDHTVQEFDGSDFENVKEIEFKLVTENGFPMDAGVQIYFEDANGNTLDSLIQPFNYFLEAAEVNVVGEVIETTKQTLLIHVDGNRMEHIKKATQIRLKGEMVTVNDGGSTVKFYADDQLGIKLGAKAILEDQ